MARHQLYFFAAQETQQSSASGISAVRLHCLSIPPHSQVISMLYEAFVVSLLLCIVFPSCIVSASENRLDRGYGARHHLDHDPIIFDSTLLEDGCSILHQGVADDNDDADNDHLSQWQSPLERLSPLPSFTTESESGMDRLLTSTIASSSTSQHNQHHHHQQQQQHNHKTEMHRTRSTGTTIVALLANNSTVLILAADTRATDGTIVADKTCKKLHALSNNVWCAGAGTSADVEALVRRVKFTFWKRGMMMKEGGGGGGVGNRFSGNDISRRHANNFGDENYYEDDERELPSASVMSMLHYIRTELGRTRGDLGANLLVGGYDYDLHRALLAAVHPHGSMDVVNYSALGSGGLAAMGVLESKYPKVQCWGGGGREGKHSERIEITVEEGIKLAIDAVRAGIENDLGSGSQIDVCVIRREGAFFQRAIVREQELSWKTTSLHDDEIDGQVGTKEVDRKVQTQIDAGVNGFGNVPFAIRSKRIVRGGYCFQ